MKQRCPQRVVKDVVVQTTCDGCGTIAVGPGCDDPRGWVDFHSYHSDWGGESGESFEHHDACSWPCYLTVIRRVFQDYAHREDDLVPTLVVDDKDWWFIQSMLDAHPEPAP